jgi:hypothetical protein
MRRRLSIAISALVLATQLTSPGSAQQPAIRELEEISALLDANDVEGLRTYLSGRPDLLEGDSELARLLVRYMALSEDAIGFLGIGARQSDSDDTDLTQAIRDALNRSAADDQAFEPAAAIDEPADDTIY